MSIKGAWGHFRTITRHRHKVIQHAFKAGIGFQGLFHDMSKYTPTEFFAGAKYYTDGDSELMPNGTILPVAGSPWDFTYEHKIGDRMDDTAYPGIVYGKGYDHNFIIDKKGGLDLVEPVATVKSEETGIVMTVTSNQPAVQFYCGTALGVDYAGKGGKVYGVRDGFCLETQVYPDSPNFAHFTNCVLNPGEQYNHITTYAFSVEK